MARLILITLYTIVTFPSSSIYGAEHPNKPNKSKENITDGFILVCGDSEMQDNCPVDCPSDYCPKSRYEDQSACPKPAKCPPSACKCRFNYRRADNGTCIPTRECPSFPCDGPFESYNSCPPYCPGENCSQATSDGNCHFPGLFLPVVNCRPACRCDKTYWRLNGTCVPYDKCPKETTTVTFETTTPSSITKTTETSTQMISTTPLSPICDDNEIVDECPVDCPSDYCPKSRYDDQSSCPVPEKCSAPACKCGFNYRRATNGTCIPTISCPPFQCNGENEEYDPCPPYCPGQSCSQATPEGKCHIFGYIRMVLQCEPACRCKMYYWRLNGTCIPYSECPIQNNTMTTTTMKSETDPRTDYKESVTDTPESNANSNHKDPEISEDVKNYMCECEYKDCDEQDIQTCKESDIEINESGNNCSCGEKNVSNFDPNESSCGCESDKIENNTDKSQCNCKFQDTETSTDCNDKDNSDNSDCGCDESDMNVCECNRDPDCGRKNSKSTDSNSRDCNNKDNNSNKSDCGCDETDMNVCKCNQDPDCGCKNSKSTDSNSRDCNNKDNNSNKSDCGCDETDMNVCECNQDPDCGCKNSKSTDSNSRDCNNNDNNSNESDCGCDETDMNVCECNRDPDCGCKNSKSTDSNSRDCNKENNSNKSDCGCDETDMNVCECNQDPDCGCTNSKSTDSNNRDCNNNDNNSNESDCGCDETDMNVCECNRDPDCGCKNSKSTDSNSRDCNNKDNNSNKSDCGCDETDMNVCECNQDPDCGCKNSKSTDSNSRDCNNNDNNSNESDCGCDETDMNVCECNRDPDCGCKNSKPTDSNSRDCNNKDNNSNESDCGCDETDMNVCECNRDPDCGCKNSKSIDSSSNDCNNEDNYSNESDCGCDETDLNVCECNRNSDCGCEVTENSDSSNCDDDADITCEPDCREIESDTDISEDCCEDDDESKWNEDDSGCETSSEYPPICGNDEVLDDCPVDCPSDYCPRSRHDDQSACSKPENCPPPACKCRSNYRRAKNGICIPIETCSPFECSGPHERYTACPEHCPGENCVNATPDGECHDNRNIYLAVTCKPACRCEKTYWRLKGICVPYAECQNNDSKIITVQMNTPRTNKSIESTTKHVCGEYEIMHHCPVDCPANYCPKSQDHQKTCPPPLTCPPPACMCGFGTKRAENGSCVPIHECPPFKCTKPNEQYEAYYPEFVSEDCTMSPSPTEHASDNLPSYSCKPVCRCKENYLRLNGNCIPKHLCPHPQKT